MIVIHEVLCGDRLISIHFLGCLMLGADGLAIFVQ